MLPKVKDENQEEKKGDTFSRYQNEIHKGNQEEIERLEIKLADMTRVAELKSELHKSTAQQDNKDILQELINKGEKLQKEQTYNVKNEIDKVATSNRNLLRKFEQVENEDDRKDRFVELREKMAERKREIEKEFIKKLYSN